MNDRSEQYQWLASEAATALDDQLARIRADQERGAINVREAADQRVRALEEHLDRLRLLREEYLS
jgi:hypothetical protein